MKSILILSHNKHIIDNKNKDVGFMDPSSALEHYSDLAGNWIDPYPKPVIDVYDGISVVQMRSNDVVYGYKNDYAWQRWMQEEVCSLYNIFKPMIQPGEITWQVQNLHVYEKHFNLVT